MGALQRDALLAIAQNPLHTESTRSHAWRQNDLDFWAESHFVRGLPIRFCPEEHQTQILRMERDRRLAQVRT